VCSQHWKPLHSGLSPTSGSPSPQMLKQRSEGWARKSPALVRGTLSRQGSTSQPFTGEGRGLRSNSDGALPTRGFPGNEKADEWAKMAAGEPAAHGVEHLRPGRYSDQPGQRQQPPRSLAHLKRSVTEIKWQEARAWAESKVTGKEYKYSRLREPRQKPDSGPSRCQQAARCEVLPAEDGSLPHRPMPRVGEEVGYR
jgi:hypothetical protein